MDNLETKLNDVFVKNAPVQLPEKAKKWIVTYSPYIGLVLGILGVLAAMALWRAAHYVDTLNDAIGRAYRDYGLKNTAVDTTADLSISFWLAWLSLLAQAVISIVAFPGLKIRSKKRGWDLLFYSAVISLVSGVLYALYDSSITSLISRLIGSAIGFYFLFQIRSYYLGKKTTAAEPKPEIKK